MAVVARVMALMVAVAVSLPTAVGITMAMVSDRAVVVAAVVMAREALVAVVPLVMMQQAVVADIREEQLVARTVMQGAEGLTITVRINQVRAVDPVTVITVRL